MSHSQRLPLEKQTQIFETAKANPGISNPQIAKLCGVSKDAARRYRGGVVVEEAQAPVAVSDPEQEICATIKKLLKKRPMSADERVGRQVHGFFRPVACPGETAEVSHA